MIRFFPIALLLLCSACIQLGEKPQTIRYYLLEPTVNAAGTDNRQNLQINIQPISFPSYLDRQQIVSRNVDKTFTVADHDRWAEPLAENFTRTIQENLRRVLGTNSISVAPWDRPFSQGYELQLSVVQFDGTLQLQTDVDIRWSIFIVGQNRRVASGQFFSQQPIKNDYSGLVAGLNSSIAQLSRQIALQLPHKLEN